MNLLTELKAIWGQLIAKASTMLNIGGIWGKIVGLILQYGGQKLYEYISTLVKNLIRKIEQAQEKKKMDQVVNDPNAKDDEKGKAYEDYFNSGRKP